MNKNLTLINVEVYSKHCVQKRCDIKLKSVEGLGERQNHQIS